MVVAALKKTELLAIKRIIAFAGGYFMILAPILQFPVLFLSLQCSAATFERRSIKSVFFTTWSKWC